MATTTLSSSSSSTATILLASPTDKASRVRQQIEFYFGDANLRKDKFLKTKIAEDTNGYVPITVLLTFNRLKALEVSVEEIAKALETSTSLEINNERTAVRRAQPLSLDHTDAAHMSRTVYMKGPFPAESTLDVMEQFIHSFHGPSPARITMRRAHSTGHPFKGSIFVEYFNDNDAKVVLEKATKGEITLNGTTFERIESMTDYVARKRTERAARSNDKEGKGNEASSSSSANAVPTKVFEKRITPNVIVRISNLGTDASMEKLTTYLTTLGSLQFCELDPATNTASLRWKEADEAANCATAIKAGGDAVVEATSSSSASAEVLQGDDEQNYWEKIFAHQLARYNAIHAQNHNRRNKRGRHGGGDHNNRHKRSK